MIYILSLLFILYLVVRFDINGKTKHKDVFFRILLIWFIAVSGLAYNVGADVPGYMYQYDEFTWSHIRSWDDLSQYRHRQPGWVLLNLLCQLISTNFVVFKLIGAIFLNVVVFRLIKKYCPYIFIGILFYAVMLYLNLNFNALRQAYSLGFFLLGFDFLVEKQYLRYYVFALLAFLFHTSAIILFAIPLLSLINVNRRTIILTLIAAFVMFVGGQTLFMGYAQEITYDLLISSNNVTEELGEIGNKFLGDKYITGEKTSLIGMISVFLDLALSAFIILFNYKNRSDMPPIIGILMVVFVIFKLLNSFIPVLFFRLMFYVEFFYIIIVATFCVDFCKKYLPKRNIVSLLLIIFICYTPIKALYAINPRVGISNLEQFYPYYSVFNPDIYQPRAERWGSHR